MRTIAIRRGPTGVPLGEAHPKARLKDAEVTLMLALIEEGLSHRTVAEKFDVSRGFVHLVASGRRRR
jgi:hypothetical protein